MDFNDTSKESEFRSKVRSFLDQNTEKRSSSSKKVQGGAPGAPETVQGGKSAEEDALQKAKEWQRKKAEAGFAAILWPKEFGGYGGSPIEQVIYQQEEQNYQ